MKKLSKLVIMLIMPFCILAQDLKDWEIQKIHEEAIGILDEYITYCDIIGDISESREDREKYFLPQLLNIFVKENTLVYNDIEPERKAGNKLPIDRYAANHMLWYPNGIKTKINLKDVQFDEIKAVDKENYYINIQAIKYISGFYLGSTLNRKTALMEFRIAFIRKERVFSEFRIAGINFIKTVVPMPEPAGQISGKPVVIQGQKSILYAVPPVSNADSVIWDFPDGFEGNSNTNQILVNISRNAKSGVITVKGKNSSGEGEISIYQVIVNELPDDAKEIKGQQIVTQGDTNIVYMVPLIKNAEEYIWKIPKGAKGTSKTNSIQLSFTPLSQSGEIIVCGQNKFGKGNESTFSIKVIEKPKPFLVNAYISSINTTIGLADLKIQNPEYIDKPTVENEMNLNYGIKMTYLLNPKNDLKLGLGLGFELANYSSAISVNKYIDTVVGLTDKDNDIYEKRISANRIKESIQISALSIPVFLRVCYTVSKKISLNSNIGIRHISIFSAIYSAKGTAQYRGYYEKYNVELFNIPDYNFEDEYNISKSTDLNIKKQNMSLFSDLGISYTISEKFNVFAELHYEQGFSNLSVNSESDFELSNESDYYKSITGLAEKIQLQGIGANIGIGYRF